ncbi:MAG: hypothetical protein KAH18_10200 [Psychromonas sp.]|nr:hypothetical protein [Psychromonas sp.]
MQTLHKRERSILSQIPFITLIPGALSRCKELVQQCIHEKDLVVIDDNYQYVSYKILHNKIQQRWLAFDSNAAKTRAEKTISKKCSKEQEALGKQFFHFQAEKFECKADTEKALKKDLKNMKFYREESVEYIEHKSHAGKGMPKKCNCRKRDMAG